MDEDFDQERRSHPDSRRLRDHLEPAEERRLRHLLEGKIQFATVQQLQELTDTVSSLAGSVARMNEWFMGGMIEGEYTEGVFGQLKRLKGYAKWIIALLSAVVFSVATTAVGIWAHFLFKVPGSP